MKFVAGTSAAFPQIGSNRTRDESIVELGEYLGGETDSKAKTRAGHSWDASVREYNNVPWKFNRVIQDIPLYSTMLDNIAIPTLSRDTGSGAGFVLSPGKTITYWLEERVKDGNFIVKKNTTTDAFVVTLTGDGTLDKPVITNPGTVNVDTTHLALFGTRTDGVYPNGNEIAEVPIATTTIEDTRTGNDPTVASGDPYWRGSGDLFTDFKSPKAAFLVDKEGHTSSPLLYRPYDEWARHFEEDAGLASTSIDVYTVRNPHETGQVQWYPRVARPATWRTLRLIYHRRILLAAQSSAKLNVPVEVDNAIFDLAVARHTSKLRGWDGEKGTVSAFGIAKANRLIVEAEHRDWPETWPS